MKTISLILLLPALTCAAAPSPSFFHALHEVETGGRLGPILGDHGKALGPLQIHRQYWQDSGVPGDYQDCARLDYSERVVSAYLRRYAPLAWRANDMATLARIHNGGPHGAQKKATLTYLKRFQSKISN